MFSFFQPPSTASSSDTAMKFDSLDVGRVYVSLPESLQRMYKSLLMDIHERTLAINPDIADRQNESDKQFSERLLACVFSFIPEDTIPTYHDIIFKITTASLHIKNLRYLFNQSTIHEAIKLMTQVKNNMEEYLYTEEEMITPLCIYKLIKSFQLLNKHTDYTHITSSISKDLFYYYSHISNLDFDNKVKIHITLDKREYLRHYENIIAIILKYVEIGVIPLFKYYAPEMFTLSKEKMRDLPNEDIRFIRGDQFTIYLPEENDQSYNTDEIHHMCLELEAYCDTNQIKAGQHVLSAKPITPYINLRYVIINGEYIEALNNDVELIDAMHHHLLSTKTYMKLSELSQDFRGRCDVPACAIL